MKLMNFVYHILWEDIFYIPLPHESKLGVSFLVALLIPVGIWLTYKTRFVQIRLFKEMFHIAFSDKKKNTSGNISGLQTLIISTATRIGMGNLVGVVAAVSVGGAGAVFWMWVSACIGMATAFVEATFAQLHNQNDTLYGGLCGGPAYYIHDFVAKKRNKNSKTMKYSILAILFALSGLMCWCGISQVVGNTVASAMNNAFQLPEIYTAIILVTISACIVLKKNATVKVLDFVVPIMAGFFFIASIFVIVRNISSLPAVLTSIFTEAFGIKAMVGSGLGVVIMNGVKRGLFSNEAGSGSAPCAAAAAKTDHPAKIGLLQAFGVFIDTIIICTCTAMLLLLTPQNLTLHLEGMDLLQASANYHFGSFGTGFVAISLLLFSFSTFIGILFYARSNVSYIFKNSWLAQNVYKIIALLMLFLGCVNTAEFVWVLSDVGVGLMTVFNLIVLVPMSQEAIESLKEYEAN